MEDITKAFKAHLYDRVSSPLLFSLAFSWAAWNYRLILIVLSGLSVSDKFAAIELLPLQWDSPLLYYLIHRFLGPLATAGVYLFLVPYPEIFVYRFVQNRQAHLKKVRQEIEDETAMPNADAIILRRLVRESERLIDEIQAEKASAVEKVRAELSDRITDHAREQAQAQEERSALERRFQSEGERARQENHDLVCQIVALETQSGTFSHGNGPLKSTELGVMEATLTVPNGAWLDVGTLPHEYLYAANRLATTGHVELEGEALRLTEKGKALLKRVGRLTS